MQCKIWNHIKEHFVFCCAKTHWFIVNSECILYPCVIFVTSYISHLKTIGSLNHTYPPNVTTSLHNNKKIIPLVNIPTDVVWKSLGMEKLWNILLDKFSKIWVFTWMSNFYYWQQILSVVFFEMTGLFGLFWENTHYIPKFE